MDSHSAMASLWKRQQLGTVGDNSAEIGKAQGTHGDQQAVHLASERGAGSKVGWSQEN